MQQMIRRVKMRHTVQERGSINLSHVSSHAAIFRVYVSSQTPQKSKILFLLLTVYLSKSTQKCTLNDKHRHIFLGMYYHKPVLLFIVTIFVE